MSNIAIAEASPVPLATRAVPWAEYERTVERRRSLRIDPYRTLADVGFDGPWVTPYQIASRAEDGPVLVALHWLDEPSIDENRATLRRLGYLPGIRFNKVLELALAARGLTRERIYVTQAFHLVPQTRSQQVAAADIDRSFDEVTRHELVGRRVVALGDAAARACRRHGVRHVAACHPSRRGTGCTDAANAAEIAWGLEELGF